MRKSADAAIFEFVARVHTVIGGVEWSLLFFALFASLAGTVLSIIVGGVGLALFFFFASLFFVLGTLDERSRVKREPPYKYFVGRSIFLRAVSPNPVRSL
jgi:hypothetical protein